MFKYSIVKNLTEKVISDVAKYLKRDYLEIRFIREQKKIKDFYSTTIQRSLDRVLRELLLHNKEYGIMVKNNFIVENDSNFYWRIEIVDNYENFANNIYLWGIYIALANKNEQKVLSITYYIPFLDDCFYCAENYGCFLNNRKLSLMDSSKILIGTDTKKISDRKFGSDILTIMYCAVDKINLAVLKATKFNEQLSRLIMNETRGKVEQKVDKVIIGNRSAVNFYCD